MRSAGNNNNNNSVVIETPNSTARTPRPRRTQSVTPVRLFPIPSTSGRPGRYDEGSSSTTGRPRTRLGMSPTNNLRPRRLNFNNNGPGPSSPPRKPRKIDVSKYEKMLKNMNTNNKNNKNNKPNNENKNVVAWLNKGMGEAKKINIPKDKRVFLLTDITNNGKIKHVWDRRFLNGLIESAETLRVSRRREVRKNNDRSFTSPLTRKKFSKNDIKAYPPTNATKNIIRAHISSRVLEPEVNKMKVKNNDKNILENIRIGIRAGKITNKKQLQELEIIYQSTGSAMFMSLPRHKYYKAYVEGKFEPHHIKFMKDAPTVVSELYDLSITNNARMGNKTIPLYKLSSVTTEYLSQFEKYVRSESNVELDIKIFIIHTLRKVVFSDVIKANIKNYTKKEISTLENKNLRNQLGQYYEWHKLAKNAAS